MLVKDPCVGFTLCYSSAKPMALGNKFVYKIFTNSKNNNKNVDLFYSFNDYYEELGENRYMYDKDFLKFIYNHLISFLEYLEALISF